jgi:hypothetical protein
LALELLDAAAQCRLRQVHDLAGASKAAALNQRHEMPDVPCVHANTYMRFAHGKARNIALDKLKVPLHTSVTWRTIQRQ